MARQVGVQVSSVFNSANEMNQNGLEVVSLLVATESGGSNITTTTSIANLNGYQVAGLDATNGGQNLRDGFAYFRGVPITSWPVSDRRRVVVINGSANSSSNSQWEIIYNEEFPNYPDMVTAINSIQAAPAGLNFNTWQADFNFPADLADENSDPDGDGASNLLEFFSGTDPLNLTSVPLAEVIRTDEKIVYRYQIATDRSGISHRLQTGSLANLTDFTPTEQESTPLADGIEAISVTLPNQSANFIRQIITIEP